MAPALIEAITVASLVLVADTSAAASSSSSSSSHRDATDTQDGPVVGGPSHEFIQGVNGVLNDKGVLKFYDTIDM